jgi:hypothetical protein
MMTVTMEPKRAGGECPPVRTMREFLEGPFTYVLPAPGGALADGAVRTSAPEDAYMAALAAMVKVEYGRGNNVVEFLTRKQSHVIHQTHFDNATDAKILERIDAWLRELRQ